MAKNQIEELIVFVDEQGKPTGEVGPKLASHTQDTKLHLAFSCYVFNQKGQFLVTQRALSKKVWPGVWTNSVCGHPMPQPMRHTSLPTVRASSTASVLDPKSDFSFRSSSQSTSRTFHSGAQEQIEFGTQAQGLWKIEPMVNAIQRRLKFELGMTAKNFQTILPKYIYKTPPYKGIIEHEFCPVHVALAASEPNPNPDEVETYKWLSWADYTLEAEADTDNVYSWWCKDQLKQIKNHPLILQYANPD